MSVSKEQTLHGVKLFLWILLVVAVLLAIWGVFSRVHGRNKVGEETATEAIPVVQTARPSASPASNELILPGNVTAFFEAPIYARTSGYLKSWYTDIGTPVKKGQLLAEIETPEVDQQLRQSKSDLATAEANANIAAVTDARWQGLLVNRAVSPQDADTRRATAQAAKATQASAQANVARFEELEGFKRLVAPFDGVVTARNTDIGALINAGQSTGTQLFRVADTTRLRIYVQVPEQYAPLVKPDLEAQLQFNEHQGVAYPAKVVRTAQALDPNLRTLQVELQVDNKNGELFPGAYAEVHLHVPVPVRSFVIPGGAVLFQAAGPQVAVVNQKDQVELRRVALGRDYGDTIEVTKGIDTSDSVIASPPDYLVDGMKVSVQAASSGKKSQEN